MLLIALIPILLAIPQLTPWLKANPAYQVANMTLDAGGIIQRGSPYADPNNGFQTQALGYRAAQDWLEGTVPWWNPYTGIGMPLAAEYQASAFFPLTLLLVLPRGMVLLQMALEIVAGLGTYGLLRQLGLSRTAATAGAMLYAVNGTLAWFSHGPASPVPFLPWILLGIERARIAAAQHLPGGWRLLAVAMALSLLAGFPETAYINGLLALCWAILRGVQSPAPARKGFAARIAAGGTVAIMFAAPQILSFFLYLKDSNIAGHAHAYAEASLFGPNVFGSLIAPYFFGPIYGFAPQWPALYAYYGAMGGYASIALVAAAIFGFLARRDAVSELLLAWTIAVLGKSFAIEPFLTLWNLVPGVTAAAFARYAQPSWELALVILAARGIDALQRDGPQKRALKVSATTIGISLVAASAYLVYLWPHISHVPGLDSWIFASSAWALVSAAWIIALLARARVRAAAALLVVEGAILFAVPILSNTRSGTLDIPAVTFLRENLGLQRFYTLEPIAPNYGAFFGIASINHNYLPVPQLWVDHVQSRLDRKWTDAVVFNGMSPTAPGALRENLRAYEDLGVKYVVTNRHQDPLAGVDGVKRVYSDPIMRIFELPRPKPYFEDLSSRCKVEALGRTSVRATCDTPSTLVRRELYFPGWSAAVNGGEASVAPHDQIFQAVAVPQGTSEVRFRYAPPHIGWAWLAMWIAVIALATPPSLLLRRKHQ
ncbi:MAG: hypothetical protein H7Y14_07080 [Burkholderiales bacterium]|nr:hypothetical protein [Burkholderiales bacterium]